MKFPENRTQYYERLRFRPERFMFWLERFVFHPERFLFRLLQIPHPPIPQQ